MNHSAFDCMPAEVLFIHQLLAEQRISNSLQLHYEDLPLRQGESKKRAVCIFEKVTAGFLKAPLASSRDSAGLVRGLAAHHNILFGGMRCAPCKRECFHESPQPECTAICSLDAAHTHTPDIPLVPPFQHCCDACICVGTCCDLYRGQRPSALHTGLAAAHGMRVCSARLSGALCARRQRPEIPSHVAHLGRCILQRLAGCPRPLSPLLPGNQGLC